MSLLRTSLISAAGLIVLGFGAAGGCAKGSSLPSGFGGGTSVVESGGDSNGGSSGIITGLAGSSSGGTTASSSTTTVVCDEPMRLCGPNCVDVKTNPSHCGDCGIPCPASARSCVDGTCICPPDTHLVCDEICTDVRTDLFNCGACGNICSSDRVCSEGVCVCDPAKRTTLCGTKCFDLMTDNDHCGACDQASSPTPEIATVCVAPDICDQGVCASTCTAPIVKCGSKCADLQKDSANCGECGKACDKTRMCQGATCVCATGRTQCGTTANPICADTQADSKNCGACGTVCTPGTECSKGTCVCTANATKCTVPGTGGAGGAGAKASTVCVDPLANHDHCGACNKPCTASESCVDGACNCNEPNMPCGTAKVCTDLQISNAHCGACGNACRADQQCVAGGCVCKPPLADCGGTACSDLTTDKANCGECGKACTGTQLCSESVCVSGDINVKTKITAGTAGKLVNSVLASLQVCNTGSSAAALGGAKIAYWYSSDSTGKEQIGTSPYSSVSGATVTAEAVDPMRGTTDYRMVVTLPSTFSLAAGTCTGEIQISVHDSTNWNTGYDVTNDYSYVAGTDYAANSKVTMYKGTAKLWGTEPK